MGRAEALKPRGSSIPDDFTFEPYARLVRALEPFISKGFSDDEAWESLFTDEQRLETFRLFYGNRARRAPKTLSLL